MRDEGQEALNPLVIQACAWPSARLAEREGTGKKDREANLHVVKGPGKKEVIPSQPGVLGRLLQAVPVMGTISSSQGTIFPLTSG